MFSGLSHNRSLGQGNVLQVSVNPQGGLCMMSPPVWLGGPLPRGVSVQGRSLSRGVYVLCPGVSIRGSLSGRPPSPVWKIAGGTHLTGKHSCSTQTHTRQEGILPSADRPQIQPQKLHVLFRIQQYFHKTPRNSSVFK